MLEKDQLIASIRHEVALCKHLAAKLGEDQLDWRATEPQRSLRELLRYLTICGEIGAVHLATDDWDHVEALEARAAEVTPESFASAMDAQMARIEAIVADVDEEAATTRPTTMPWGTPIAQGQGFVEMVVKPLCAYRMQLFLHAKESGLAELDSRDCWIGPMPAPAGGAEAGDDA